MPEQPRQRDHGVFEQGTQWASKVNTEPGVVLELTRASELDDFDDIRPADLIEEDVYARETLLGYANELAEHHDMLWGTNRLVFIRDTDVVKIPLNARGYNANSSEASHSRDHGKTGYVPIADSRIEWLGSEPRVPVLVMERVTPARRNDTALPDWADSVDCAQIGWDKDGILVAYDL